MSDDSYPDFCQVCATKGRICAIHTDVVQEDPNEDYRKGFNEGYQDCEKKLKHSLQKHHYVLGFADGKASLKPKIIEARNKALEEAAVEAEEEFADSEEIESLEGTYTEYTYFDDIAYIIRKMKQ